MPSHTIPNSEVPQREILASHARCRQYGVDPNMTSNPFQTHLSIADLASDGHLQEY